MDQTAILERAAAVRHGRRLEYFTIAWNALEGLVAAVAGAIAGSISLAGFGIDSFIEVTSGSVLLWRMHVDAEVPRRELNERRALRIVGVLSPAGSLHRVRICVGPVSFHRATLVCIRWIALCYAGSLTQGRQRR